MVLVDTHCHLNFEDFETDRQTVLERAAAAGVAWLVNPSIDLATSQAVLTFAEKYERVYAAVGIHPNEASGLQGDWLGELRQLTHHPKVVAIGEIGLDDYWERTPRPWQEVVFEAQLDLAAELRLPVIIHCRERARESQETMKAVLGILARWQRRWRTKGDGEACCSGVLHSFSGDVALAEEAISLNFFLGVNGVVTFRNAQRLHEVVRHVPLEALLIETDAPFLTPHPHRGERNEPAHVRWVCQKIAELRGSEETLIAQATTSNAQRLFRPQS